MSPLAQPLLPVEKADDEVEDEGKEPQQAEPAPDVVDHEDGGKEPLKAASAPDVADGRTGGK